MRGKFHQDMAPAFIKNPQNFLYREKMLESSIFLEARNIANEFEEAYNFSTFFLVLCYSG